MDKNAIKKYAVWARGELIKRVSQKALQYGITAEVKADPDADSVNGRLLTDAEKKQRGALICKVKEHGYEQVIEEVAYTWFNRFAALRFMEVNGYLPSHVRVFTNAAGEFKPQILSEAIHLDLDGIDMDKVYELKNANKDEELFKYLLIVQCNALNKILPGMFQRIEDFTELLLSDYLLREGSVIDRMVKQGGADSIPESDWTDQVQIIGWLYQYYNTEPKDKVFAGLKKNVKITRENIPAATQLFTPDWIVRYMVENSLGRLWLEGHPNDALKSQWKYYLDEAEQEAEVQAQLDAIRREYAALKPEDIKCIDPCMGSGHILCYLFDVLIQIYESQGYSQRDAAQSILRHNLYGLDIDKRAAQLSYFAIMMKARQYDRRFFFRNIQPKVYSTTGDEEGENYGALVTVENPGEMPEDPQSLLELADYEERLNAWSYRYLLAQKYHVVVTNPPYMAVSNGNGRLQDYVKKNFPDSKADLFAVFMERCGQLAGKHGYQAMITQHAWMFLSSFEKLRAKLQTVDTVNMVHLGPRAFEEIGGEVVQTTSFVMRKSHTKDYKGTYCRLIEPTTQQGKEDMFLAGENRYVAQQDNFSKIPGSPVAYWASEAMFSVFTVGKPFGGETKKGVLTGDNNRFLRLWHEVSIENIGFNMKSQRDMIVSQKKWFPVTSGGEKRKWYGNFDTLVNLENDGSEIKSVVKNYRLRDPRYYMLEAITWTEVSSGVFSCRYVPSGILFGNGGPVSFFFTNGLRFHLGLLNTNVAMEMLRYLAPTINYGPEQIDKVSVIERREDVIDCIVDNNITLSRADWDSFETSWDFRRHPLV